MLAPLAFKTVEVPMQIQLFTGVNCTCGRLKTITVTESVFAQPAALTPVTVYMVVIGGDACTVLPVDELNETAGDQV